MKEYNDDFDENHFVGHVMTLTKVIPFTLVRSIRFRSLGGVVDPYGSKQKEQPLISH